MVLASLPTQISNYLTLQKPWRSYKQPDIFLSEGGSTTQEKSTEEKAPVTTWTPCHDNVQRLFIFGIMCYIFRIFIYYYYIFDVFAHFNVQ